MNRLSLAFGLIISVLLGGCADPQRRSVDTPGRPAYSSLPTAQLLRKPGGFYTDDGPDVTPPVDLNRVADAQPRVEPLSAIANEPYSVFGRDYAPIKPGTPYKRQGSVSWYGRKFHGQRTASGEIYDMFAMTAAHPTLPVPSYARVVNLENGRSVIVKINDRGPYSSGRMMDLSYAAAYRLGFAEAALTNVEVEAISVGPAPQLALSSKLSAEPATDTPQPAPAALPQATDRRGIFLQLGAFGSRANADSFLARLQREFAQAEWIKPGLDVELRANLHRVQVGPYASRADANAAAARIRDAVEIRPVIFVR